MKSKGNKNNEKQQKGKTTWGNVEPGQRTEGEQAALGPAEANAQHPDSDHVTSPNMEPHHEDDSSAGGNGRTENWQQLSKEEKKRSGDRKGGYPKN
jgi:hypothetical protein